MKKLPSKHEALWSVLSNPSPDIQTKEGNIDVTETSQNSCMPGFIVDLVQSFIRYLSGSRKQNKSYTAQSKNLVSNLCKQNTRKWS